MQTCRAEVIMNSKIKPSEFERNRTKVMGEAKAKVEAGGRIEVRGILIPFAFNLP